MPSTTTYSAEHKEFWDNLYKSRTTPWDLGQAAPPFLTFLNSPYAVPPGRMAVLGAGNGHDCLLFAKHGFEVTAIDFSPEAVQNCVSRFSAEGVLGTTAFLLERDIFQLDDYENYYDYVLEHCTYCAIDPSRRRSYVRAVYNLLKPGGKLISLWWTVPDRKGGPPFAVSRDEIYPLFKERFSVDYCYVPQDSVKERSGQEFFTLMTAIK